MSYKLKVFEAMTGDSGGGNSLQDKLNQWLSFHPSITPISVSVVWPEGTSRRSSFVATLLYREGGPLSRFWSTAFSARPGTTAEAAANTFLADNPNLTPSISVVVSRPGASNLGRVILLLYAVGNWAQVAAGPRVLVGTPLLEVGVGSYGTFADADDANRPAASALNLGNVNWPVGGSAFLFSTTGNNPDRDALAGVPPCCSGSISPPDPPTVVATPKCTECFPPRIL